MPIAQRAHIWEVKAKMRSLNLDSGKVTKVPPLSQAKAVEQGSELLSELIIYSIASFIVVYEYNRSSEKDEAKEEKLKADREMIKGKILELEDLVAKQNKRIAELTEKAEEVIFISFDFSLIITAVKFMFFSAKHPNLQIHGGKQEPFFYFVFNVFSIARPTKTN